MQGRLYDPAIGRFISADPYVQYPLWGQSLNRYSYGFNNPMSGSDPTGFSWLSDIYSGDKVTWNPHSANMFNNKSLTGHVEMTHLEPGGPIDCALFPRVWPPPA